MKRFICLQAGHQNAKNNCDPVLARGTGAPGEADFNIRTRDRLSQILLSKKNPDGTDAFSIQLVDACFNCDPKSDDNDYALFLAIHYDADVYNAPGGFVDFPEPNTDGATKESQRIAQSIREEYFPHAGIENHPERSNANTRFYYMWKFLSAKTPCVIIECGVGQNAHDKVILADKDIVANAIARGICKAFGVSFDAPAPIPDPTPTPQPDSFSADAQLSSIDVSHNKDTGHFKVNITAQAKKNGNVVAQADKTFEKDFALSLPAPDPVPPQAPDVVVSLSQKINFGAFGILTLEQAINNMQSMNSIITQGKDIKRMSAWWWIKYALYAKLFS